MVISITNKINLQYGSVKLVRVLTAGQYYSIGTFSFIQSLSFLLKVGKVAAVLISAGTELNILGTRPKKLF